MAESVDAIASLPTEALVTGELMKPLLREWLDSLDRRIEMSDRDG